MVETDPFLGTFPLSPSDDSITYNLTDRFDCSIRYTRHWTRQHRPRFHVLWSLLRLDFGLVAPSAPIFTTARTFLQEEPSRQPGVTLEYPRTFFGTSGTPISPRTCHSLTNGFAALIYLNWLGTSTYEGKKIKHGTKTETPCMEFYPGTTPWAWQQSPKPPARCATLYKRGIKDDANNETRQLIRQANGGLSIIIPFYCMTYYSSSEEDGPLAVLQ